jgi:glycosyltransferase involved in cell wall biosynthesis
MKVCFFSPTAYGYFNPDGDKWAGGAETQQVLLARHMVSKGIEVSFIVGDYGQADVEIHEGITVIKSFTPFKGNRKLRFLSDMSRIRRAMEIADADVYNQRSTSFYTGQLAWFASRLGKAFTFSIGSDYNCYRDCLGRLSWPMTSLYSYGIKKADAVISQTEKQRVLLETNFGRTTTVIRNGIPIDADTQPRKPRPESDGRPEFLWVSSIRRIKRPELVLELARQVPEADFTIIGGLSVEESYSSNIAEEASKIDNIRFTGFVHPNEIDEYYSRAYIYINTSSLEGFPNTYLHSWRNGLPVFTIDIDPDSLITENEIGFAAGSFDRLLSEVRAIVKDPGRRDAMSARALEYVRNNHDIREKGDQYIELFELVTGLQKSSS